MNPKIRSKTHIRPDKISARYRLIPRPPSAVALLPRCSSQFSSGSNETTRCLLLLPEHKTSIFALTSNSMLFWKRGWTGRRLTLMLLRYQRQRGNFLSSHYIHRFIFCLTASLGTSSSSPFFFLFLLEDDDKIIIIRQRRQIQKIWQVRRSPDLSCSFSLVSRPHNGLPLFLFQFFLSVAIIKRPSSLKENGKNLGENEAGPPLLLLPHLLYFRLHGRRRSPSDISLFHSFILCVVLSPALFFSFFVSVFIVPRDADRQRRLQMEKKRVGSGLSVS